MLFVLSYPHNIHSYGILLYFSLLFTITLQIDENSMISFRYTRVTSFWKEGGDTSISTINQTKISNAYTKVGSPTFLENSLQIFATFFFYFYECLRSYCVWITVCEIFFLSSFPLLWKNVTSHIKDNLRKNLYILSYVRRILRRHIANHVGIYVIQ